MFVLMGATVHVVTSLELDEVLYLAVAKPKTAGRRVEPGRDLQTHKSLVIARC
jgi:hypothetical protein